MLMNIVGKIMKKKSNGVDANFEDIQRLAKGTMRNYILINTMSEYEQSCLIKKTLSVEEERDTIEEYLKKTGEIKIIIYGKNAADETVGKKYTQLKKLGFSDIFMYRGGMFEWLLLQDIYGADEFPTTCKELDLIKYRNPSIF